MKINLSDSSAAVLLRCLCYGENAVSQEEIENGTAEFIEEHINLIRKSLASEMFKKTIEEYVSDRN